MKVEAVSVCVNYADLLAQVAPHNRRLLDRWVVVTRPEDEETRAVCRKHSIEVLLSEEFDRGGGEGKFNKARGINAGLRQLTGDGWLLHLDGDMCLPWDFKQCLEDADLREGNLYGAQRLCVPGWEAWQALQKRGLYSRQGSWLVEYRDRPAGCYVGGVPAGMNLGYTPIGYFQLWWGAETLKFGYGRKWYPTVHGGAARTDVQFACLWERNRRILVPELLVFHLEDAQAHKKMGLNWKGRKSPPFAPVAAGSPSGGCYE